MGDGHSVENAVNLVLFAFSIKKKKDFLNYRAEIGDFNQERKQYRIIGRIKNKMSNYSYTVSLFC